jgi:hypothetical protein
MTMRSLSKKTSTVDSLACRWNSSSGALGSADWSSRASSPMCVETTVRMAGNLGFDTYLVHDACATNNRVGLEGTDYEPDLVHDLTVANLNGEFCSALAGSEALGLLQSDAADLNRRQGNE